MYPNTRPQRKPGRSRYSGRNINDLLIALWIDRVRAQYRTTPAETIELDCAARLLVQRGLSATDATDILTAALEIGASRAN